MPDAPLSLAESLRRQIAAHGPIPFHDFMARSLYDPAHGYYGAGKARLGRRGDFFTNVSVGPLFGRLLARQFVEMWQRLGEPVDFTLVEQGAHDGQCAADVLGGLAAFAPTCLAAATLYIVEPLAVLEAAQRERLRPFPAGKIRWARGIEDLPGFRGVHYSNELIDAFPVRRVVKRTEGWRERSVACQDGRFVFVDTEILDDSLKRHLRLLPEVPVGYETEVNLGAAPWLEALGARLHAGYVLVIDYGFDRAEYYRPERTTGTLSAYAAHQRAPDPLAAPGDLDLTAHVDFTTLMETAGSLGMAVRGFTDQHRFMVGLSRLHFADRHSDTTAQQKELRAFKTLMHPELMGRSFRILCLSRAAGGPPLSGFEFGEAAASL